MDEREDDGDEELVERSAASLSRGRAALLTGAGFACLGLAFAGVFLPVLPTTPLVLVAAACFARSSPRFYARLLADPTFGPVIRDWRKNRVIPLRVKLIATSLIVVCGVFSMLVAMPVVWARVVFGLALLGVIVWIWSYPHAPSPDTGS